MEESYLKIHEELFQKDAYDKIQEELLKDENFKITSHNIREFIHCDWVFEILEKYHISYKIKITGQWNASIRSLDYNSFVEIYVTSKDYPVIKDFFHHDEMIENEIEDNDTELEEDDLTKKITTIGMTFIVLILLGLGVCFIFLGINLMKENQKGSSITFIILGSSILFFTLRKVMKSLITKHKKNISL